MAKRLFLLLFISFMGVSLSPRFLTSADEVSVVRVDDSRAVETVPLPDPEPVVQPTPVVPVAVRNNTPAKTVPVVAAPAAGVATSVNYTVTYQVSSKAEYNSLAYNLSFTDIYKYQKLVYGHNASNLLLSLKDRYVGETISITEGGVKTSYKIMWKQQLVMDSGTALKAPDGQTYTMGAIAKALGQYDLALMTCSGQGNTPYRWVLFANKV